MIEARHLVLDRGAGGVSIDDVCLRVDRGEIYALFGPAGSGKTTLIDLFTGARTPDRGQAIISDIDAHASPLAVRGLASFVTVAAAWHGTLTVAANVQFLARMAGVGNGASRTAIENALRRAGMAERDFDRSMRDSSRGISMLAWLALASLRKTPALLIDEPTAGLDERTAAEVYDDLLEFRRAGVAVLVTTSDVSLATKIADRVGIIKAGRIAVEHTRAEFVGQGLEQFESLGRGDESAPDTAAG